MTPIKQTFHNFSFFQALLVLADLGWSQENAEAVSFVFFVLLHQVQDRVHHCPVSYFKTLDNDNVLLQVRRLRFRRPRPKLIDVENPDGDLVGSPIELKEQGEHYP